MTERKFSNGQKVLHKDCICMVVDAKFTYLPEGAWWIYELDNGNFAVFAKEYEITEYKDTPNRKQARKRKDKQDKQK